LKTRIEERIGFTPSDVVAYGTHIRGRARGTRRGPVMDFRETRYCLISVFTISLPHRSSRQTEIDQLAKKSYGRCRRPAGTYNNNRRVSLFGDKCFFVFVVFRRFLSSNISRVSARVFVISFRDRSERQKPKFEPNSKKKRKKIPVFFSRALAPKKPYPITTLLLKPNA